MRIIAGKYRSRKILLPKDSVKLRPTSDRARETLFDVLSNIADFENAHCLDLFAGTGAFGFESLSRGADLAVFVDLSARSVSAIEDTASQLECSNRIEAFKEDTLHFLRGFNDGNYDFIFADPPYDYGRYDELTQLALAKKPMIFVLETSSTFKSKSIPAGYDLREKNVGAAKFSIFISK